jgi:hypothetical protein
MKLIEKGNRVLAKNKRLVLSSSNSCTIGKKGFAKNLYY